MISSLLLSLCPLLLLFFPYCPHIVVSVPHKNTLLLLLCPYIIIVMSTLIILWLLRLLYIEMKFCHLYHARIVHLYHTRIVHLCNVKEFSPWRAWFWSHWSIFYSILWASWITFGIRALDSRVLLLQIGHHGIFTINSFLWHFQS